MYLRTNKLLTKMMTAFCLILCLGISNVALATVDANGINLEPNSSYATCDVSADGTATVIATGGVQPYTYLWSTGETFVVASSLLPGDYQVTVTDATGCVASTTVSVMVGPEGIWLMPTSTPATCGSCDGTADPHAMLGAPPYTYQWSDGQTTPIATGLCPGDISVTVTDSQGCSNSTTVFVSSAGNLNVTASSTGTGCTTADGTATANPTGGMAPYTYSWSNGGTTQTITGLAPGTYTVTVTSAEGCQGIATVVVEGMASNLSVSTSATGTACGSATGSATANATGGVPPYTYSWSNGATTAMISGLAPGVYTVTVTDSQGCFAVSSVEVAGDSAPNAGTISTNDPTTICAGDGEPDPITVNTSGASTGVAKQWVVTDANGLILALPPSNVIDLDGAGPGLCLIWCLVYDGSITGAEVGNNASDIQGCFDLSNSLPVDRLSTEPATISTTDPTVVCVNDMEDDFVDVTVDDPGMGSNAAWVITDANGVILALPQLPPFNFEPTGAGNCLIWYLTFEDGLMGAELGANAADLQGCFSLSDPILIERNDAPTVTIDPEVSIICPGEPLDLAATSSATNVTYEWFASAGLLSTTDEATTTYTMMMPGDYQILVSVTDENGCMGVGMATVTVMESPDVTITDNPDGNTICAGASLDLSATSSDPDVTYAWTASAGTIDPEGADVTYTMMMPGTYTITVEATNAEGCIGTATTEVTVEGGTDVSITDDPNGNTICTPGESLNLSASSSDPDATFAWTASGGSIDPEGADVSYTMMMPGTYTITVVSTSAEGCTSTTTTTAVVGIFDITAEESSPISECGGMDGEASVTANSGNGDFTYEWSNGETGGTISGLGEGTYTVTVTDVLSGCTQEGTVEIDNPGFNIGNYVWFDNSEDCLQDQNESGAESVPVNLMGPGPDGLACTADDVIVESTITDSEGFYLFECVNPGTYYIQFFATVVYNGVEYTCIDGDGSGSSSDPMNNDDNNDSDADPETGKTMPFDLIDADGDGLPEIIDMNGDGINDKDELSFDAGIFETCNNVTSGGQVAGSHSVCPGEIPPKFTSVVPAGGGGTAPIEYLWICSPNGGVPNPGTWIPVPNSNSDCLQLGPAFETRFYARCARREGCPEFVIESNVVVCEVMSCAQIITFNTIMNEETVEVSWITDNDASGATYHVERSTDGANFEVLTEIASTANDLSFYNFSDESPAKGMNYYRIKRIDASGNYVFSDISQEMNRPNSEQNFEIFPNPVSSNLTIENVNLIEGDVQIEIISTIGTVNNTMKMDASSYNKSSIDTNNLPAGVYYLRVLHGEDQVELIKFTKIN